MFPFLTSRKKPRKLLTDDELETSRKNDTYYQRKRILDSVSYMAVSGVVFFVVFTAVMVYIDQNFRTEIANIIKSEFKPIVYAVFTVFGIKVVEKK